TDAGSATAAAVLTCRIWRACRGRRRRVELDAEAEAGFGTRRDAGDGRAVHLDVRRSATVADPAARRLATPFRLQPASRSPRAACLSASFTPTRGRADAARRVQIAGPAAAAGDRRGALVAERRRAGRRRHEISPMPERANRIAVGHRFAAAVRAKSA